MFEITKNLAEQVQEQQKDIIFLHKAVLEILDVIKEIQKEIDTIKEIQKEGKCYTEKKKCKTSQKN